MSGRVVLVALGGFQLLGRASQPAHGSGAGGTQLKFRSGGAFFVACHVPSPVPHQRGVFYGTGTFNVFQPSLTGATGVSPSQATSRTTPGAYLAS